jgi:hypothetical protein
MKRFRLLWFFEVNELLVYAFDVVFFFACSDESQLGSAEVFVLRFSEESSELGENMLQSGWNSTYKPEHAIKYYIIGKISFRHETT